ncbi:hypothetical protein F4604DRAFT_1686879 [Suillus subluteus]|nr:hypothetical protein F4604DRAFT_1686879 [Suillus subluteus]
MEFPKLSRLTDEDLNTDDEMGKYEDDEESYQLSACHSFSSLCATLPAHTFYCEDSRSATISSAIETLRSMPTESSLGMDSSPPGLFNRDCATPGPSNREAFISLRHPPPPRFEPDYPQHYPPMPGLPGPSNMEHMQGRREERERVRHSCRTHLNFPGIHKVFIYEAARPMEGHRGQLITTGVIRATNETAVSAPVPSSRALPPPFTPPSPATNIDNTDRASRPDPPPQPLTTADQKEVMKEAKQILQWKVMLDNTMPDTPTNKVMARTALLEATKCLVPTALLDTLAHTIPHYDISVNTICNITSTVHTEYPSVPSPVNHPAVITTILRSVWGGILHEALNFDDVNTLDNLISIGGAAVGCSLMEYEDSGAQKTVHFGPSLRSSAEYGAIQHHNEVVRWTLDLHHASRALREGMVARGMSLREIR